MTPAETFTVLGATGFIGRYLAACWRAEGHSVFTPARGDRGIYERPLGHVVYAIGVTADFRTRPFETMEAHVSVLCDTLRRATFDSFTYLSSTRIYGGATATSETTELRVDPGNPSDLYNLSKLAGESLCLAQPNERVRIARLSNVYGPGMDAGPAASDNFLSAVIREAATEGGILLRTAPHSAKDYLAIDEVRRALFAIALRGTERIYNVAAGKNTTHGQLTDALARITGCTVDVAPGAPEMLFPDIDTRRIEALFTSTATPWKPPSVLAQLPELLPGPLTLPAAAGGTG